MFRHYYIFPSLSKGAWIGVDLFFVLSGFLVSGLLFQEYRQTGKINPRRFFIRRGFKIYPVFWVALLFYLGYYYYKHYTYGAGRVWAELLFVQNFTPGIMGISWSLAIEEHFYLILVLFTVWALKKDWIRRQRIATYCFISIALICLGLRTWLSYSRPFDSYTHFFPTYLRLDALFAGVLLSWFYQFRPALFNDFFIRYRVPLLLCMLAGLSIPFLLDIENPLLLSIGLTIIYSSFTVGIGVLLAANRRWDHPAWRPVIYIGKCSYSIYLVHLLVGPAVAHFCTNHFFPGSSPYVYAIIYVLANIASGILLSLGVEQFFLRLRDRWFPKFITITITLFCVLPGGQASPLHAGDSVVTSSKQEALLFLEKIQNLDSSIYWPNVRPRWFMENLQTNINTPLAMYQGSNTNFCGYAALSYLPLHEDPLGYVKFMLELYREGHARWGKITFDPSPAVKLAAGTLHFKGILDIRPADQMWFLILADQFKGYLNFFFPHYHPGSENTFWASVNFGKFNRIIEHLLGYEVRSVGSDLIRPHFHDLFDYLSQSVKTGTTFLYVNNNYLHKKNHNKSRASFPTHFIVLTDIWKTGEDFTIVYWDYGGRTLRQVRPSFLKKILFGVSRCTKKAYDE